MVFSVAYHAPLLHKATHCQNVVFWRCGEMSTVLLRRTRAAGNGAGAFGQSHTQSNCNQWMALDRDSVFCAFGAEPSIKQTSGGGAWRKLWLPVKVPPLPFAQAPLGHFKHSAHAQRGHPGDLTAVQQQLARPLRRVIETIGLQIFRNIGVDQPNLAAARIGVVKSLRQGKVSNTMAWPIKRIELGCSIW
jgi:hypothetical protein